MRRRFPQGFSGAFHELGSQAAALRARRRWALGVRGFPAHETLAASPHTPNAVIEPSVEGGFTVYVPALPGCISEGDTRDEAMSNIREAIELYLEPVR